MRWLRDGSSLGIDPVGTSGGLGAVAGIASLAWPFFDGLTAALVALAAVGWLSGLLPGARSPPAREPAPRWAFYGVIGALLGAWAYFLAAPGGWLVARGVVLGAAGAGVAWVGRRGCAFGEGAP